MSPKVVDLIEQWPVDRLIPYARNARVHTDAQVSQIAGSIREFGFVNPILVGDDKVIVAGHGRLMAAQQLGMETVPVIVLGHLSDTQRRALLLADNQITLAGGWSDDVLRLELQDLDALAFDLDLLGFAEDELSRLLEPSLSDDASEQGADDIPEPEPHPVSRPGDLWICGDHKVLCGDATDQESYQALLGEELADMCFQDSPYNVDYGNTVKDKLRGKDRRIMNDNLGEGFYAFLLATLSNTLAVTKGACYLAMSSSELDNLQKAFREAGGKWSTFIIWAKNTFTLGRADYQRQYEPILYGWKSGNEHYWCGARDQGDVWFINKPAKNDLHPTMKPVALVERAVRNSSKTGDIVLDSFGGSGTTMIACEKTGRRARLLELDPKYVDVIVTRWQGYASKQATRASDGQSFDELALDAQSEGVSDGCELKSVSSER